MKIKLFGGLRGRAGVSELTGQGATVRELLIEISEEYQELGEAIFADSDGNLRPHIRIIINGIDSELAQGQDTPLKEEDQIAIFPPIAGG